MQRLAPVLLIVVVLGGCGPGVREAAPYEGIWRSPAWGTYLAIGGGSVEIFEFSSVHCISVASGGARGIGDVLVFEGTDLVLTDAGRTIGFEAVSLLPTDCVADIEASPRVTFDALAATFEAHYRPGLDDGWADRAAMLRPGVAADEAGLRDALRSLLAPLARADVRLATGEETWVAAPVDQMAFPLAETPESGFTVGTLGDGISYLGFRRLGALGPDPEASHRAAAGAIDSAMTAADFLVLDLRGSSGGSIDHAMLVASRLVPTEAVVATMEAHGPEGSVAAGEVSVRPLPTGTYAGSTAVLIGPGTVGVAELLAAALARAPGVTLVGQPTAGSPAPGMVRLLPNGWSVGLPNLRVRLVDGTDLSDGVIPDIASDDSLGTALEMATSG